MSTLRGKEETVEGNDSDLLASGVVGVATYWEEGNYSRFREDRLVHSKV